MDRPYAGLKVADEDRAAARRYAAAIEWSAGDDVSVATVSDIPNPHAHGATREAAVRAAGEVTALWIAGAREPGISVPQPRFPAQVGGPARVVPLAPSKIPIGKGRSPSPSAPCDTHILTSQAMSCP